MLRKRQVIQLPHWTDCPRDPCVVYSCSAPSPKPPLKEGTAHWVYESISIIYCLVKNLLSTIPMKNDNHHHKILQGKAEHKQRCIRIYIHVERPELHAKRKKKMAPIKKKKEKKVNIGPSCYASSVTKFFHNTKFDIHTLLLVWPNKREKEKVKEKEKESQNHLAPINPKRQANM